MKKVTVQIPAKLNLTLDILGKTNKYHSIRSLVASINVYDTVTVVKRQDDVVTLREQGYSSGCQVDKNNAFKAAKLFMDTFYTPGVDIILKKNIPIAGGLGGSSADAVAVLKGMNKLYDINGALVPLADKLGSDTTYMLTGGYSILSGRGNDIEPIDYKKKFYLILCLERNGITSTDAYASFDEINEFYPATTDVAVNVLKSNSNGAIEHFATTIKNDFARVAIEKVPEIKKNIARFLEHGAIASSITGSGTTTFGLYRSKKERDVAFNKLKSYISEDRLVKAHTLP